MSAIPKSVRRAGAGELSIEWSDGHKGRHLLKTLRDACPCASCGLDRETGEGKLLPILNPGQYDLQGVDPVGSYALQISWADGHRTGIYTYEYLRRLCECEVCVKAAVHR